MRRDGSSRRERCQTGREARLLKREWRPRWRMRCGQDNIEQGNIENVLMCREQRRKRKE